MIFLQLVYCIHFFVEKQVCIDCSTVVDIAVTMYISWMMIKTQFMLAYHVSNLAYNVNTFQT